MGIFGALLVLLVAFGSTGLSQTFVAEWNAAAEGGVGPTGMALSNEGGVTYLYVSDHPRSRVLKINTATGAVAAAFGKPGNASGDFNAPYGIARDPVSGDLYVAERGNHRVSRMSSAGVFIMSWGTNGSAQGQFNEPVGVAVDAAGDVYVTEHANHRVQKFRISQTGGVWSAANLAMWGTQGSGNGQFNMPYGITADANGNIWVADGFNGRVQRFNLSGVHQSTLGSAGTAPGQFIVATWLGMAPDGELFVTSTNSDPQNGTLADANNQWISRFTSAGVFTSRFGGTFGTAAGQFRLPVSAVVANNRVYVADYYNSRIQVFELTGGGPGGTDTTAPTIATFTTGVTTPASVTYQIIFSEAVTGVNSADFAVVTSGGAVATIGTVTGSGATYSVPVTFTGAGALQLNLNASGTGIVDAANNALGAGATGPIYTIPTGGIDTTAPAVATFAVGPSDAPNVNFVLTFSEAVTGVNAADFAAVTTGGASATIGIVTGSGASYTIPVSYTGTGTVRVNLNPTGTGIVDAAGNAIATGATGPLFTITPGGTPTGTQVSSITPPPNGTYGKNEQLAFVVRFNGIVTVSDGRSDNEKNKGNPDDDEDDDEDNGAYFSWTAVGGGDSGKVHYVSGSGTNALTFRLKVHNGDLAPGGILLGTVIRLEEGAVIRDASGAVLDAQRLTLPWTQNPLSAVVLHAPKPGNGNGGIGNNGNGKGRNDRLVNLSSRLRVTGGDASRSVVAGFVVTGEASKQILIRAVGPGLAGFGVRDSLGQPLLVLRDTAGKTVAENDGWKNSPDITSAGDKVGAFRLGNGSRDAALLVGLAPGAYTAQVTANGNGIVLLEVYDMISGAQLSTEQIVNISTRGFVGTGDDVLVAGFVVTGSTPKRVLIRGIGPALAAFGVPGVLQDPVLRVYAGNNTTPIAQNDNWEAPQPIGAQAAAAGPEIVTASGTAGAFPLGAGGKDAAIVVTLPAGSYSAVVSGVNNGTGAGLVEVYELP